MRGEPSILSFELHSCLALPAAPPTCKDKPDTEHDDPVCLRAGGPPGLQNSAYGFSFAVLSMPMPRGIAITCTLDTEQLQRGDLGLARRDTTQGNTLGHE